MIEDKTILYVEDDPTSRKVMEMMMDYVMGHSSYTIFENSTDFPQRFAALQPQPDIVFLDIHVQPYSGFQMLDMIREHPAHQETLVIALTASVMSEEIDQLEKAGFDGAIAKPIKKDVFPQLVRHILQGNTVWHVA